MTTTASAGIRPAVGQPDGADPAARRLQLRDLRAVAERDARIGRRRGQRLGDRRDTADGMPDARTDVELRDHGVGGDGAERGDARIERLEAEQPAQPVVAEGALDVLGQPGEPTAPGQREQLGPEQVQRRVEVPVDERVQLQPVELGEVGEVATQSRRLAGPAQGADLRGERVGVGVHVQLRTVGELRAIRRLQGQQGQPVLQLLPDGAEGVGHDLGRGEDRRARCRGRTRRAPRARRGRRAPGPARARSPRGRRPAAGAPPPALPARPRPRRRGPWPRERSARSGRAGGGGDRERVEGGAGVGGERSGSDRRAGQGGLLADPLLDAGARPGVLQ